MITSLIVIGILFYFFMTLLTLNVIHEGTSSDVEFNECLLALIWPLGLLVLVGIIIFRFVNKYCKHLAEKINKFVSNVFDRTE